MRAMAQGMVQAGVLSLAIAVSTLSGGGQAWAQEVYVQYGDRGTTVREIQRRLGVSATGYFGPETEQAVRDFQAQNGLAVDGIVGPETLDALDYSIRPVATDSDAVGAGTVATRTGIGLNIRSGPGLSYPIIDAVEDGTVLDLGSARVSADGYEWAQLADGRWLQAWVASDYVREGQEVAFPNPDDPDYPDYPGYERPVALRPSNNMVKTTRGFCRRGRLIPYNGSQPVGAGSAGPYAVVVPTSSQGSQVSNVRTQVRQVYSSMPVLARATGQGPYVDAGTFSDVSRADCLTAWLRDRGIRDARVVFRP